MPRTLKTDIPGIDRRVAIEAARTRDWKAIFAGDVAAAIPLVVELGFGRGEFLLDLAQEQPERAHVGVEVSWKRVLKMARRVARLELANLRLVHATAEEFVRECLDPASVAAFWVNFSDPWPKKRHHRRRMIQDTLVRELGERLQPGGRLEIATDDVPYAEHIDAVLRAASGFDNRFAPDAWRSEVPGRKSTAYELLWRAEGRPLHFWSYVKR